MKRLFLLLLLLPAFAQADFHKCQQEGRTLYQDVPCPEGTEVHFDSSAARLTIPAPSQPGTGAQAPEPIRREVNQDEASSSPRGSQQLNGLLN